MNVHEQSHTVQNLPFLLNETQAAHEFGVANEDSLAQANAMRGFRQETHRLTLPSAVDTSTPVYRYSSLYSSLLRQEFARDAHFQGRDLYGEELSIETAQDQTKHATARKRDIATRFAGSDTARYAIAAGESYLRNSVEALSVDGILSPRAITLLLNVEDSTISGWKARGVLETASDRRSSLIVGRGVLQAVRWHQPDGFTFAQHDAMYQSRPADPTVLNIDL
jgi:hypothetical protein